MLLLGDLGIAVIGTLVAALAVRTRARDLLGPLLALPLLVPVVIGGARATAPMLALAHAIGPPVRWPLTLALYDLVFGLIAYAVFDFLWRTDIAPSAALRRTRQPLHRPRPHPSPLYGRGLRTLSSPGRSVALTLSLVFFYAPLEAEQGFLQKIFYVHVPLAIVALCGFVLGGLLAIQHLRTREARWDMRSYVVIHMSLIFAVGTLITGSIWARGIVGALVGVERAHAGVVPDRLPAVRDLPAAALRDRRPRASGALRLRVRDHRGGVRADELHRRAAIHRLPAPARAGQHLQPPRLDGLTFLVSLVAVALLFATLCKYELTAKHARAQLRALRRLLEGETRRCTAAASVVPSASAETDPSPTAARPG